GTPAWEIQFACTPPELRAVVTMEKLKGGLLSALHSGESGFMGKPGESMIIAAGGERKMVQQMTFLIKTSKGYCMGGMLQDITAKKEDETILKKRLELMEFSFGHSLIELMQKAIDELEYLGSSSVGFFHILEDDQSSLKTSVWSTRTRDEYLQAIVNQERVTQVGASWKEVLRKKTPVIHNNDVTLGLQASPVLREIFLPIQRDGRIIAVLGVGNKPSDYTEREVEILTRFADYIGDIVERKIAEGGTQRMLDILETAQDLISSADLDGRLTYLNPAGRVMLGISPGTSLSNYRLTDFHSAEIAEIILEQALPQAQQVGHWEGESVIQSLQGRKYSVLQHIVAHRDGSGQISHYSTIVNDITDLKVADKALRDSEYRNRSLLNAIPDMMFRIGQDGTYLDYKADKNQQLYVPPEVFLGKKIEAVMPPDIHDLFRTEMAAAFQTETLHTFEYQLEVGGKLMFFEARVEANLNAAESIVIVRDITEQKQAHEGLLTAYDATIRGWSRAMDLRDQETEDHTQRVTELTEKLARSLNLPEEDIIQIRRGALLHDIGKLGIPDGILLKPGKLTKEEWVIMQQHPQYAYDMLSPITYLHPALDIPYCHHEKWDGSGYPRGLSGEQIPLAARLFAVVDVWDALRSNRPYRQAWSKEKVLEYISSLSGTHFDPMAVELFLRMQAENE
ncbi:MAG: PAS domain-containing protein, partial [Chloroflexi bacterium]|nr:PAS domain-containing protein [Chloroflexota bacterium]